MTLPSVGWGEIAATEADVDYDEPGEPKTGWRRAPVPPILVRELRQRLTSSRFAGEKALLFRTRTGSCPTPGNWGRAWKRGLARAAVAPIRVYDCRHAAGPRGSTLESHGAEAARRLGHSVATLVSTNVGALEHDEHSGNQPIESLLDSLA